MSEKPKNIQQVRYEQYDFENCPKWQKFLQEDLKQYSQNLDMARQQNQKVYEDVKKMWYKSEIDPEFDTGVDFDKQMDKTATQNQSKPEEKKEEEKEEGNEVEEKPKPKGIPTKSKLVLVLYHLENVLKIVFMMSTLYFTRFAHYLSLIICLLAIYRQIKRPRWNQEYARKLAKNEFTHNLFYMAPFSLFYHARDFVYFIPLMMHYWLGLCNYFELQDSFVYKRAQKIFDKTIQNKDRLLLLKSKIEIYMMGWQLFLIFVWGSHLQQNILLMVFYVNFLRLKYMISDNTKMAFYEINKSGEEIFAHDNSHQLVKWTYNQIKRFCIYIVDFESKKKKQQEAEAKRQQQQEQFKQEQEKKGN